MECSFHVEDLIVDGVQQLAQPAVPIEVMGHVYMKRQVHCMCSWGLVVYHFLGLVMLRARLSVAEFTICS